MQEIEAAQVDLIVNPPLQVIDGPDGTVSQPYMGIPKLPDFIQRMFALREKRSQEWRRHEAERQAAEMRELEQEREANPERFMGWGDFIARVKQERPEILATPDRDGALTFGKTMPAADEPVSPILLTDSARNAREQELEKQKQELLKGGDAMT